MLITTVSIQYFTRGAGQFLRHTCKIKGIGLEKNERGGRQKGE